MNLKLSGTKTTFFVDKYFYYMQVGQCGFALFILVIQLTILLGTGAFKWKVNAKSIQEFTTGQTQAIQRILLAHKFIE